MATLESKDVRTSVSRAVMADSAPYILEEIISSKACRFCVPPSVGGMKHRLPIPP
jgi:hypothetical protein